MRSGVAVQVGENVRINYCSPGMTADSWPLEALCRQGGRHQPRSEQWRIRSMSITCCKESSTGIEWRAEQSGVCPELREYKIRDGLTYLLSIWRVRF